MKTGKYKWTTLVWYVMPSIHIHGSDDMERNNISITIAWLRSSLFLYWRSNKDFKPIHLIPTLMYRDTYFNEFVVLWLRWHWILFSKRNKPAQWDKKVSA